MYKKIVAIFLLTLITLTFALHSFFKFQENRQEKNETGQTDIILENVKDRFRLFLNLPQSIGIIGADYFSTGDLLKKNYDLFEKELLELNEEIIGLTLINQDGKIIRVFPEQSNPGALGKTTQNIEAIKKSIQNGEKFWLSPPFTLYQGPRGFAYYIPIYQNSTLRGWFAPVMSADILAKRFKLAEYLEYYDLIIKDKETNLEYLSTAVAPQDGRKIHETTSDMKGRTFVFQTWRKKGMVSYQIALHWSFLIALVLSFITSFMMKLYEQRKKTMHQLENISILLRLTAREALSKLVDVHTDKSENLTYITHLIEQIDLLQTMANSKEGVHYESHKLLPILEEQIENLNEVIVKKNLNIKVDRKKIADVAVCFNGWLFQNSVLANIFTHSLIHAESGSSISVEYISSVESHFLTFHTKKIIQTETSGEAIAWNRRMEVARSTVHIYQGELYLQNDMSEGFIIRVVLPVHT